MDSQTKDNTGRMSRVPEDPQQLSLKDPNDNLTGFPRASDLAQLWDPLAHLRASILKGNNLLPYFDYSGTKFEQMLQEMLHREVKKDEKEGEEVAAAEERRAIHNGGGVDRKASPDRRDAVAPCDGERGVLGVMCRWCSQLFPNVAVLLQHERYHCKMNREPVEVPEGLCGKETSSQLLHFPRSYLQPENNSKPTEATNSLPGGKSPLQKPSWQAIPQQLLVAMHSPPQPHHDSLRSQAYWSHQEKGCPSQAVNCSPEVSSPRGRRIPSSEFGSPACLNLASCPPDLTSPQNQTCNPWSQNEPLDLSLPKQLSDQEEKTLNGNSAKTEKREFGSQQLRRPSPTTHLSRHHHPVYSRAGAPMFPGSLYNGFSIFNQSALGLPGHEGMPGMPFSQPASSPGFLSPMAYMMEADAEAALKKLHQEKQALMVSDDPLSALFETAVCNN